MIMQHLTSEKHQDNHFTFFDLPTLEITVKKWRLKD